MDKHLIDFMNKKGQRANHTCCTKNILNIIQIFLDNGVDINSSTYLDASCPGYTPLHYAVEYGCRDSVNFLCQRNANTNRADKTGSTPLHLACRSKRTDRLRYYWNMVLI